MPVYNGESFIGESIRSVSSFLKRLGLSYEVIVVDDGSRDATRTVAQRESNHIPNVRVTGYSRNRGKGAALLHGYRHSRGDVLVFYDSDLDVPPQQIPLLLTILEKTGADIVVTNKWHPLSRTRSTRLRRLLSWGYNALVRLVTGLRLSDTQTGAKALRRSVLDTIAPKMHVKRYAFDAELLLLAAKHGYRIAEAPSLRPINLTTPFKLREMAKMLLELLSIAYRHGRV